MDKGKLKDTVQLIRIMLMDAELENEERQDIKDLLQFVEERLVD